MIIAVDGYSASGKSTFAAVLAAELDAVMVHGDDFYRVMDEEERIGLSPAQGADLNYDWARLREQALQPIKAGRAGRFRPYDWATNDLSPHEVTIPARPVVVVEGLFVSRPELADLIDFAVFVAADPELRQRRQHERADASQDWLQRWEAAEDWYFRNARAPETFDAIVAGD